MTSLRSSVSLRRTFSWILAGAGAFIGSCGRTDELQNVSLDEEVSFDQLHQFLRDRSISEDECLDACASGYVVTLGSCSLTFDPKEFPVGFPAGQGGQGGALGAAGAGGQVGGEAFTAWTDTFSVQCSFTGYPNSECEGRRHVSWGRREAITTEDVRGGWFARAAANEAGSVHSFRALAAELRGASWGREFMARLRRAAREEIRHTRAMRREARSHGATLPKQVFARSLEPRPLVEIALENAREGCAAETYAALVAAHQARHASSDELRICFEAIAVDETSHAELAWDLHERFLRELPREQATAVDVELRRALRELEHVHATPRNVDGAAPELVALGLPVGPGEQYLRRQLAGALHRRADELRASVGL